MSSTEQHAMYLHETHPSGAEEWVCPTCDCRYLMQWSPYRKIVLEAGDEYALHSGAKGGVKLGVPAITESQEEPAILSDDLRDALDSFLADLDFGD